MNKYLPDHPRQTISILLLVVTGFLALFAWQNHQGFSLLDEGYLWYGAQRTMVGEVPMRDFQAYDIGRYYWSAAFMSLWGDNGIVGLRLAATIFQVIAIYIGLAVLVRNSKKQSRIFWLLAAVTLVAWMAPQWRLYDISLAIILVGTLAFLIEQPTRRRYFLAGLILGLVAVFGRNHGLYGLAGSIGAMIYLTARRENGPKLLPACLSWGAGIVIGYLPVLVFFAVVPGFAQAFWGNIRLLFEIKGTNYPLPVPWPWLVPFGEEPIFYAIWGVLVGIFFIAIVAFGVLGIIWAIRKKQQNKSVSPTLLASIFLALPYAHYAYSRADILHLGPSIPPFLMGILALSANQSSKIKWSTALLLCGSSLWVMLLMHPAWSCYFIEQCVEMKVGVDNLKVGPESAMNLTKLNILVEQFAPGDRTFIAAPFWPGAYAAMGRKSPMWEIYATTPRSIVFQEAEIERIKGANPAFVMILDGFLDGREELSFHNTHPVIDQYIQDNFEFLNDYSRNTEFLIYKSKQADNN